jgi:hypothetical protein
MYRFITKSPNGTIVRDHGDALKCNLKEVLSTKKPNERICIVLDGNESTSFLVDRP